MERVDCVVIGAGVVGLAVARRLAQAGREVIVLEREEMIGTATSSRNSEVIHAGIYYPSGSLKAQSCVAGKHQLYAYCAEHGVPHRRCGKLIVATTEAQQATLEQIRAKAAANGVSDLEWLAPAEVAELEPEVFCTAALLSPSTGIIDSHGLMLAYQGDAEDHGAMLAFGAPVERGRVGEDGIRARGRRRGGDDAQRADRGQQRRAARAGPRRPPRGAEARAGADALLLQGQLLHAVRREALLASGLSGARAGRARRPRHHRPRRPGPLRARRRVGRRHRLRRRPQARRGLLRRHPDLLPGPQGRRARAGLCRHAAEDLAQGRPGRRLRRSRARASTACPASSTCSRSRARA